MLRKLGISGYPQHIFHKPRLVQAPPNADSSSKDNNGPAAAGGSVLSANGRLPYLSIFAVLTLDSVVIYDTHHARPLCIVRGLHYAGLTDAVWSADGRTLMVTSTDGYISILSFADGELGEVYVPPVALAEARVMQEEAAKLASRTIAKNSAAAPTIPPCEPGQSAVIVAPPAKNAKTDAHAPVMSPLMLVTERKKAARRGSSRALSYQLERSRKASRIFPSFP